MPSSLTAKEIEQLSTTPGDTIYTCPDNKTAEVRFVNCTNESNSSARVTIHVVQSGGSLADSNIYTDAKFIGTGKTDFLPEIAGLILSAGDFIIAFGSAGGALNLKLGIKEIV